MPIQEAACHGHYELEIQITAPRERVWQALTNDTNAWWLPDFHMVGPDSVVRFDAVAGGTLIESLADGGSLLWYTVMMVTPGETIHMVGHLAPPWGGPTTTMLCLSLEDTDDGCTFKVTDALFGRVSDDQLQSLESGWRQLFGDGLKAHVER